MSEIQTNNHEASTVINEASQPVDDRAYRQGLSDYVAGRRDTEEARYYVSYWTQEQTLGGVALQSLAE